MKYKELEYNKTFPLKEEKYRDILDAIKHLDVIVAGGYCLTKVQALHGNFLSIANDLDIFCLDDDTYQKVFQAVLKFGHILNETASAATLRLESDNELIHSKEATIFQIIKPPKISYKDFDELIEDFDLNNSKYWTMPPFDNIYTKQDNRKLFEISCSGKKWNYHFLGRIVKYFNKKHLILPYDETFQKNVLEIVKRENKTVYKLDRSNYTNLDNNVMQHLDSNLFGFIMLMYEEKHPASFLMSTEIKKGYYGYLHLEKIFQPNIHRAFEYPKSNFLFDYWLQKIYHEEIKLEFSSLIASVGPRLENVEFYEKNSEKVKKVYPELFL